MSSGQPLPRLPRLILLGTVELGLLPFRLAAKLLGGLLLLMAAIGVPAWLIQLLISLLGGGSGGGPLPAWAMLLLLGAAAPAGVLFLHVASIAGPLRRPENGAGPFDDAATKDDEPDPLCNGEGGWTAPHDPTPTFEWAYRTLELEPSASLADVKAAYRQLAKRYHPDHNPGFTQQAADRLAGINAAYEALVHELGAHDDGLAAEGQSQAGP